MSDVKESNDYKLLECKYWDAIRHNEGLNMDVKQLQKDKQALAETLAEAASHFDEIGHPLKAEYCRDVANKYLEEKQ